MDMEEVFQDIQRLLKGNLMPQKLQKLSRHVDNIYNIFAPGISDKVQKPTRSFFDDIQKQLGGYQAGKDRKLVIQLISSMGYFIQALLAEEEEKTEMQTKEVAELEKRLKEEEEHEIEQVQDCEELLKQYQNDNEELSRELAKLASEFQSFKEDSYQKITDAIQKQKRISDERAERAKKNHRVKMEKHEKWVAKKRDDKARNEAVREAKRQAEAHDSEKRLLLKQITRLMEWIEKDAGLVVALELVANSDDDSK